MTDLTKSLAELDERIATMKTALANDVEVLRKQRLQKRIVGLAKAELTRRKTAEVVAKTERTRRKIAKLRSQSGALDVAKGEAEQLLFDLLATQAAATAQLDEIARRVDVVYNNAQAAYGAVTKQRDIEATVERRRLDQIRADLHFKASQTSDPDLKRFYLSQAENPNAVN